jgi:hypothetical protein
VKKRLLSVTVVAFMAGFGAVLLGSTLERAGFSPGEVGLVLAAVVAGTVVLRAHWDRRSSECREPGCALVVLGFCEHA